MENAVDAIKIAFGLLVFAIAIALTFSVVGQVRATSDIIFTLNDKTSFYEYATEIDYNTEINRIVGLETILPTIHRYAKEQYAVTIFDSQGNAIVRYDLYTEGFMSNWNEILKRMNLNDENAINTYNQVKERLDQVQYVVNKELQAAGLDTNKYSVHKLRHTAATLMYQYGNVDIRALQVLLGHERICSTEIYTHVDNMQVRNAGETNPLAKL